MSIVLQGSTSGSITLQEPAIAGSNTINLPAATGTMALLQTPSFATTIGVGGATPAASGAGITFPATQSASTDGNTLDDYEEGTWTPSLTGQSGSISSYGTRVGLYVKVGQLVFVQGYVSLANKGTISGSLNLSGLPFTSNPTGSSFSVINARFNGTGTISSGVGYAQIAPNTASGGLQIGTSTGITAIGDVSITNTTDIVFTGVYRADA